MNSQSPHPTSTSSTHSRPSAFEWPVPNSPNNKMISNDISLREILDKFSHDQELLKHALMAKVEEDKKQTAKDTLKTEHARIHLKQLDMELMREQSKIARYHHSTPYAPSFYSLAPIQQQVIARITGSEQNHPHPQLPPPHHHQPPISPIVYPHSAHPLCPPDNDSNRLNPPRQYHLHPGSTQPTTPISPSGMNDHSEILKKRTRASISYSITTENEDKISHNKVMEALKAKIQRGSSSPLATTPSSAFRPHQDTKRQRTLPKPHIHHVSPIITHHPNTPSTPSPRSGKPVLPPIDTSIGRIPTKLPSHPVSTLSPRRSRSPPTILENRNISSSCSSSSSSSASSSRFYTSSPSGHALSNDHKPDNHKNDDYYSNGKLPSKLITSDNTNEKQHTNITTTAEA
ncbi:hypothetical protein BDB01DRAFT_770223 [Pilobolus umbonatus]|nr:hypothetical protein BDB01DRAFT_770223 [Pilobolus umbonatus]